MSTILDLASYVGSAGAILLRLTMLFLRYRDRKLDMGFLKSACILSDPKPNIDRIFIEFILNDRRLGGRVSPGHNDSDLALIGSRGLKDSMFGG